MRDGSASGRNRGEAGVSLIEMLIVVALLGMIAVILTLAVAKTIKRQRVAAAAQEIRSDLQAVYTKVLTTQQPVYVRINLASRRIDIMADTAGSTIYSYYALPTGISLSTQNIAQVQCNWPTVGTVPMLECDALGRTIDPNTGEQVTTLQTLSVTHNEMVLGYLRPRIQYVVTIYPLWNTVAVSQKW